MRDKVTKQAKRKRTKITTPDAYGTKTTVRNAKGDVKRITYKPK
jgi:hypothetical protein